MFAQTEDQEVFERTCSRFMETHYPVERIRALAREAREKSIFEPERWRESAELGWTSLLVPEEAGGGSISDNGLADLLIVASLFGRHAAPGPLLGTNAVAAALGRWGSEDQRAGPLAELIAGECVAGWGHASTRTAAGGGAPVEATPSGNAVILNGRIAAVESAADCSYLLVTAGEAAGGTHYLIPLPAPGVELSALGGMDLTRRFDEVTLRDVEVSAGARVGEPGAADDRDEVLLDLTVAMLLAEMVGAMDRALSMTLEWAQSRYSFGRPLGSYQEIKHRLADMRTHLEAAEAVTARTAATLGSGAEDARAWASGGMAYLARHGPEVIQDCIQLHGGIGVTWDHDLHFYLRRVALDANLCGNHADFARRLGRLVAAGEGVLA